MYKAGDKFEIEIEEVLEHENTCLYRIRGFHSLIFDNYGLNKLKKIDAPKVEKELHIGDEVVAATGRPGVVVDCHVPNLDGEDKYTVCFANKIFECSRRILTKTGKHYNTFTEYLREVRTSEVKNDGC